MTATRGGPAAGARTLAQVPGIRRQILTGLLAQVTQGAGAVGVILVVREHTGSLTLGGAVAGVSSIAAGVARPIQGRLIDRRGPRRVMAVCGVLHAGALGGIVALAALGASAPPLVLLGAVAGLALPPVSTTMRVEWGRAVGGGDRTPAYSLVYLTQELAILSGPLVLAGVVALASPAAGLSAVAVVAGLGTLGFAVSMSSVAVDPGSSARAGSVLRNHRMRLLLAGALLVGGALGALEVAAPALAAAHRAPAAAGLLVASLSAGGIAGAAAYGTRRWRIAARRRLLVLLGLLTAALGLLITADDIVLAAALLFLAGIPLNPALATFSLLVDEYVPARSVGEAFGWLSTAIAGGTGAASALAAALAQHTHDPRAAFVVAAIAAAAATTAALLGRRMLAGRAPAYRRPTSPQ